MKRVSDTENYYNKMSRTENEDDTANLCACNTYIVTDEPQSNFVKLKVQVDYSEMLTAIISLREGDLNLYNSAKRDIMKYLIKKHPKLTLGQVFTVYVFV
ncbi:unknown [Cryptophlebia leucotreta granulovirus]|uniref:Uncharacterized protein n=1 Tax=Cryptophlebia leucotreta granulosis virus TaxID=35254 RepID=Q7T5M0_GVCL|nr:hypothetical protein [Cryptophlebia leucotreta granulovirus]AAQ21664.1 unknown [Cryptophlebia leucotreta granulovirus]